MTRKIWFSLYTTPYDDLRSNKCHDIIVHGNCGINSSIGTPNEFSYKKNISDKVR